MENIRIILGVVTIVAILYPAQLARAGTGDISDAMQCVGRLTQCRNYIHSVDTPPSWCCDPMKEIAQNNATCLCTAFDHPEMLRLIDLTQDNALHLLRSCGANYDASLCSSTTPESSSSSPRSNAAIAIISLLGFSFVSAYIGL